MATLHGYVNTMQICATNVDAYNCDGIYASGDLDNGVVVTLDKMNLNSSSNQIEGFEYTVSPANSTSKGVWLVATPEVGYTIEQQELADPRYFTNAAGRPMALRYLVSGVDVIEVTKECFTDSTLPTTTNKYITVASNGKFQATSSDPSGGTNTYFEFVGYHTVSFGMENAQTAVMRVVRN